jgi:hypothetical protein
MRRTILIGIPLIAALIGVVSATWIRTDTAPTDLVSACAGVPQDAEVDCFADMVVGAYHTDGLDAAAALMEAAAANPAPAAGRFAARCHDIAHALGKAVDVNAEPDLEQHAPQVCRSGFFHGVHFQQFAQYDTTGLVAAAAKVCVGSENLIAIGAGGVGNGCRHALGHELVIRGVPTTEAATACTTPPQGTDNPQSAIEDCLHGVYMERFLQVEATENWAVPGTICGDAASVSIAAAAACYGESGLSLYRFGIDNTPQAAFAVCNELTAVPVVAESCIGGIGRTAAAFLENDEAGMRTYCAAAGTGAEVCLIESVAAVMEAEQDVTWKRICAGLALRDRCAAKLDDIEALIRSVP